MLKIDSYASGSTGNLYRLDDGHTQVLLECGISYRDIQRALNFEVSKLAGCLVTHEHMDHCRAVNDMLLRGVPCYMSEGTALALGIDSPLAQLVKHQHAFQLGTWLVMPFNAQHDADEPLGYLLDNGTDRVLYATDTYYLRYKFPGCTAMLIECNHSYAIVDRLAATGAINPVLAKRLMRSHLSLENLKTFLAVNDLSRIREIHLIHLSDGNSDSVGFKREIAALTGVPVYVAEKSFKQANKR